MNTNNQKTCLIVDDDLSIIKIVKQFLEGAEYKTTSAVNGIEAVDIFKTQEPDLVIMDYNMPKMNGLEACKIMRKHNPKTPIIILTSNYNDTDLRMEFMKAGANRIMPKLFSVKDLMSTIEELKI